MDRMLHVPSPAKADGPDEAPLQVSAREQMLARWEALTHRWLEGDDRLPEPFGRWRSSYRGVGEGRPTTEAMAEPYIGNWDAPRLVTLALNPGQAELSFQGRDGYFADQVRQLGSYQRWAESDPYASALWETKNRINPIRKGRRPNPHRAKLGLFAQRWLGRRPTGRDLLMLELYPWHSTKVTARIKPPSGTLKEFLWDPLAEVDVDTIWAFGRDCARAASDLGLTTISQWGGEYFTTSARAAVAFRLPSGQRLVVVWQLGYAGPPGQDDVRRLRALLA